MKKVLYIVLLLFSCNAIASPAPPPSLSYDLDLVNHVTIACFDDVTCKNKDTVVAEIPALKPFADFIGQPYTPPESAVSGKARERWPSGTREYEVQNFLYHGCEAYVLMNNDVVIGIGIWNYTYRSYAQSPGGKLNACKLKVDLNA